ncbi:hypothetical protein [Pricia sp.]|uniref:hypothetical protein n=1 Tax=Pricia sp. TaxID=2268138 RepID=UPI003593438B
MQLQRLKRNQIDIAQYYGKLRSYVCEPKTYEQFVQLNRLRDSAERLRDANIKIGHTLKNDTSALLRCARMLKVHLKNFDSFREDTLIYLRMVKSHRIEDV